MADLTVTPSNVFASTGAQSQFGVAGVAITAGQALYVDTADSNKLKLADSDGTSPSNVFAGISLHAAAIGQPIKYVTLDPLFAHGATGVASGDSVWLADTAGGITKTFADLETGDTVIHLGVANSTTTMNLNPTVGGVIA